MRFICPTRSSSVRPTSTTQPMNSCSLANGSRATVRGAPRHVGNISCRFERILGRARILQCRPRRHCQVEGFGRVRALCFTSTGLAVIFAAAMLALIEASFVTAARTLFGIFAAFGLFGGNNDVDRFKDRVGVEQVGFQQCEYETLAQPERGLYLAEKDGGSVVRLRSAFWHPSASLPHQILHRSGNLF